MAMGKAQTDHATSENAPGESDRKKKRQTKTESKVIHDSEGYWVSTKKFYCFVFDWQICCYTKIKLIFQYVDCE